MPNYYLDIETTGLNPEMDTIITIQFQELDSKTGKAVGKLHILKAWEFSEKEILQEFLLHYGADGPFASPFSFVVVGYNLGFEHNFLKKRLRVHDLQEIDILSRPFIDLRSTGIIMNNGEFKGSGLDKLTKKNGDGKQVPIWFKNKEYDKIVDYIEVEAKGFIQFNAWLYKHLPSLLAEFKKENNQ